MKRNTPQHPKTLALAAALNVPVYSAVGLLEMMWHFTATYTPRGDIGRFSDAEICRGMGWTGRPGELIDRLVDSRWIDSCQTHRLIVHDWADHMEEATKKRLDRSGEFPLKRGETCLDNGATRPASRGAEAKAMAEALAKAEAPEKTKNVAPILADPGPAALAVVNPAENPVLIIARVGEAYAAAGRALSEAHQRVSMQLLLGVPGESRQKLLPWVQWAIKNLWRDCPPKALPKVIADGDYTAPITPRITPRAREPSRSEQATLEALEINRRYKAEEEERNADRIRRSAGAGNAGGNPRIPS